MNINKAFPSNYLSASDLGDRQPIVTIERVEIEKVGRDREEKPVLYFEGKKKGMVLNKTNATKITSLLGTPDTERWTGQRICVFATETQFGGDTVECIRVRAAKNGRSALPEPDAGDQQTAARMKKFIEKTAKTAAAHSMDAPPELADDDEIPF